MLTRPTAEQPVAPECKAMRTQTFAACDGELSPHALHLIDAHLDACAACQQRFAADATFHAVVRAAVSRDVAPPALRERILLSLSTRSTVNAPA
jgi:mycothiol system anti-sigma-R factor